MRGKKRGFTLAELMIAIFISMYVFLCALAMYMMGWSWWYEILPQTECQRIARITISIIAKGMMDSTVGADTINFVTYGRRNGLEHACRTRADVDASFITPTITDGGHRINFKLESAMTQYNDSSFYLDQDGSGVKAVYYKHSDYPPREIKATRGITDLTFEPYPDPAAYNDLNFIKVTTTVQRVVRGSRKVPYQISIVYTDYIYLRNI